jgi:cation diffusion facilitator family transporter
MRVGMSDIGNGSVAFRHSHSFLGEGHERSERKTWAVIGLCGAMMIAEIVGGLLFGSIALVADGMHMSTHAGALFLAALAYSYARKHTDDPRFTFGTGKLGDLAGFTSAIILAMIAILIGYEAVSRILTPVPIHFAEAIPIACLGLAVNIASAWILSGGGHQHGDSQGHSLDYGDTNDHTDEHHIVTRRGTVTMEIFEEGVPPRFRLRAQTEPKLLAHTSTIETIRPGGARQTFTMKDRGGYLESVEEIPEPHVLVAWVQIGDENYSVAFEEHEHVHGSAHRDNNMRAAVIHVMADAAVSLLVIVGLLLARTFGWLWMDPLRPRPSRRDRLGHHARRTRTRLLSNQAGTISVAFAPYNRGTQFVIFGGCGRLAKSGRRCADANCPQWVDAVEKGFVILADHLPHRVIPIQPRHVALREGPTEGR